MSEPQQLTLPAIEAFRKLDQEREKAREVARTQAIKKAEEAIAALNELGFRYTLSVAGEKANGAREIKDVPCSVCGFKTNPLHDARSHRGQDPKKAFTADELKARTMTRA